MLKSQSVQIREQIINLVLSEHLSEAFHFVPTEANDIAHSVIIGGHSAHAEILMLEHAFQTRPLAAAGRIRRMAAIAILIVDVPSGSLLWVQPQLGVTLPALGFTTDQGKKKSTRGNGPKLPTRAFGHGSICSRVEHAMYHYSDTSAT